MFNWLDRFRFIKRLRKDIEWNQECTERKFKELREELKVLKCISNLKEYKIIEKQSVFIMFGHEGDEYWEKKRKEARDQGFQFAFKKERGEEIWVKYEAKEAIK